VIDKAAFDRARQFIATDIGREIQLARALEELVQGAGVTPGGGNVLAALGLVCYTEFAGKLAYGRKKKDGSDAAAENFNLFFDDLGPGYLALRNVVDVYKVVRCGLAHEYFVKRSCKIAMLGTSPTGIYVDGSGMLTFVVEAYLRDLLQAIESLGNRLFP